MSTDDDDPFDAGIELEFDAMEARRQRLSVVKTTDKPQRGELVVGEAPGLRKYSSHPPPVDEPPAPALQPLPPAPAPALPHAPTAPPGDFHYKPLEVEERPPPPLTRTILLGVALLVAALAFLVFWYRHELFPPDAREVVAEISEGPKGEIVYAGQAFEATLETDAEVEGSVHQVVRASWPEMPFITHELVLVTGDYAKPDIVSISEIEDHTVVIQSNVTNPAGSVWLVHVIPADQNALEQLLRVQKGQYVVLVGDEAKTSLRASDGTTRLETVGTSKVVRLREVMWEEAPPEAASSALDP